MSDSPPLPRSLVELTVLAVLGRFEALRAWRRGLTEQPGVAHREALLQVHLFAGFPRLVEAFGVLEECGGLGPAGPGERLGWAPDRVRGREFFERIYAAQSAAVAGALERFHPELAEWILGHAYGRVLTRPGLAEKQRELLAVAALIATDQERQLASHVRGAARLGAGRAEFEALLGWLGELLDAEQVERARRVVERFGPGL